MPAEVSIKISRINRSFIESFAGDTIDDKLDQLVSLVQNGPTVQDIDYILALITSDLIGAIPNTSNIDEEIKKYLLSKLHENRAILERREELVAKEEKRELWRNRSG